MNHADRWAQEVRELSEWWHVWCSERADTWSLPVLLFFTVVASTLMAMFVCLIYMFVVPFWLGELLRIGSWAGYHSRITTS